MSQKTPLEWIREIEVIKDPAVKAALLAGLVSDRFCDRGFQSVVVAGSAIEFYIDGVLLN